MYNLIIVTKDPHSTFALNFKTEAQIECARQKLKAARKSCSDNFCTITDDFGQTFDELEKNIATIITQCQKGQHEIATERNIDQARHNDEFLKRRNDDIELIRLFPGNVQHNLARA